MMRPPPCPRCDSEGLPTVTLVGPKGIPLDIPNALGFGGSPETFWGLIDTLRVTLKLRCAGCGHEYAWTRETVQ